MNTSGHGTAPYPAKFVDRKILVAISEFSLVPNDHGSILVLAVLALIVGAVRELQHVTLQGSS
jgi:hypothetical protein